jgi:hypothetical protein
VPVREEHRHPPREPAVMFQGGSWERPGSGAS